MFKTSARWIELGIDDSDKRRGAFTKGTKYLLPRKLYGRLRSVEARIRQISDKVEKGGYTIEIEGFRPYRWLPFTAYENWKAEFDRLKDQFDAIKQEIFDNWGNLLNSLADEYTAIAVEVWDKTHKAIVKERARNNQSDQFAISFGGKFYMNKMEFVDEIVDKAIAKFPNIGDVENGLTASYRVGVVATQSESEIDIEMFTAQSVRDNAGAAEVKLAAMRQAELEYARKQILETASPIDDAIKAICARVVDDLDAIQKSIQKNGYLRGKPAVKGKNMLAFYEMMAALPFADDLRVTLDTLKQQIGDVGAERKDAGGYASDRNTTSLLKTIERAKIAARNAVLETENIDTVMKGFDDLRLTARNQMTTKRFDALELDL